MSLVLSIMNANQVLGREVLALLSEEGHQWFGELRLFDSAPDFVRYEGKDINVEVFTASRFDGTDLVINGGEREVELGAVAVTTASPISSSDAEAPIVIPQLNPEAIDEHRGLVRVPTGANTALALIANALGGDEVEHLSATILHPVSCFGPSGIEELYGQVRSLFNHQTLPTEVLGDRLAFNILPGTPMGQDLAAQWPCPVSRTSLTTPVFGGTTLVMDAWLKGSTDAQTLHERLDNTDGIELSENVQPADILGQSDVRISTLGNETRPLRLLAVVDEIRRTALTLVRTAQAIAEQEAF